MKCETIIEDLQAYLDNELQDTRRNEIEMHLHDCNDCMMMVGDLKDVSGVMQTWDVPEPILFTGQQLLAVSAPRRGFILRGLQWFYDLPFKVRAPIFTAAAAIIVCLVLINYTELQSSKMSYSSAPTSDTLARQEAKTKAQSVAEPAAVAPAPASQPMRVFERGVAPVQSANEKQQFADESGVRRGDINLPAAPSDSIVTNKEEAEDKRARSSEGTAGKLLSNADAPMKMKVSPNAPREQMIIKSAQLSIETTNFDESKNRTSELVNSKGGYITKLQVSTQPGGRVAEVTLKVPARNFEHMVSELRKFGKVVGELVEGQDVSDRFYEVTDEIDSEKNQEKDVKDIIEKNRGNISTKMEAQRELDQIRRQRMELEREREQIREGSRLSTIVLSLRERLDNSQIDDNGVPTMGQQVKQAFGHGLTNLLGLILPIVLFIGEAGLSLIVIFALFYVLYLLGRRYVRKNSVSQIY